MSSWLVLLRKMHAHDLFSHGERHRVPHRGFGKCPGRRGCKKPSRYPLPAPRRAMPTIRSPSMAIRVFRSVVVSFKILEDKVMGQHPHQIDGRRPIDHHRLGIPQMAGGVAPASRPSVVSTSPKGAGLLRQLLLNHFHIKPFLSASAAPCRAPVLRKQPRPFLGPRAFQHHAEHQRSDQQTAIGKGFGIVGHVHQAKGIGNHLQQQHRQYHHPPRGPCRRLDGRRPAQRSAATAAYRWNRWRI